jgi:germination protein M
LNRRAIILTVAAVLVVAGVAGTAYSLGLNRAKKDNPPAKVASKAKTAASAEKDTPTASEADQILAVRLYFADSQAQYLIAEDRQIPKTDNPAFAAVQELIKGPKTAGNNAAVPNTMVVQSVTVTGGVAAVDFGAAFNNLIPQGEAGENMFIYSIVDTLTNLDGINQVKFLAGGAVPAVPSSRRDFSAAFSRNDSIIKK